METLYKKVENEYVPVGAATHLEMYPGLWLVQNTVSGSSTQALRIGDAPIVDVSQSAFIKLILDYVSEYINEQKLGTLHSNGTFTCNIGWEVGFNMYKDIINKLTVHVSGYQNTYDDWFDKHPQWTKDDDHMDIANPIVDKIIESVTAIEKPWTIKNSNVYCLLDAISNEAYKLVGTPTFAYVMHKLKIYYKDHVMGIEI